MQCQHVLQVSAHSIAIQEETNAVEHLLAPKHAQQQLAAISTSSSAGAQSLSPQVTSSAGTRPPNNSIHAQPRIGLPSMKPGGYTDLTSPITTRTDYADPRNPSPYTQGYNFRYATGRQVAPDLPRVSSRKHYHKYPPLAPTEPPITPQGPYPDSFRF